MRLAHLLALAGFLAGLPLHAGLSWQEKKVNLKAGADSTVLEARYHFANAGKAPVMIQQIESSCGCTTAELEKRRYEPGESGEIVAKFTVGARVGLQTKTIAVKTDDAPEPVTLTLTVDIPELVRIRPTLVYWMQGDAQTAKTMTLEVDPASPVDKITVQSSNPLMTPQLKEIVKGARYELTVSPGRTDRVAFSMINLECAFAGARGTKTFRAYATVKPAEAQ